MQSIPAVRVSSAQARGAAKRYSYWGAVRYRLEQRADGWHAIPEERATSDRRSFDLAAKDARALAASEGRVYIGSHGPGRIDITAIPGVAEVTRRLLGAA